MLVNPLARLRELRHTVHAVFAASLHCVGPATSMLQSLSTSVVLAGVIALMMAMTSIFIVFFHDRKHDQLDRYVDFSFSGTTLRQAFAYYRFMAVAMLFYYVLFTCSCVYLQYEGHVIFKLDGQPQLAGPIATSLFSLDLVLRGGFFDVMEHFGLRISPALMNSGAPWFVIYAFIFRMYYALSLIKILLSFAWIYGKVRIARQAHSGPAVTPAKAKAGGQ